ncbi:response regulator [Paenibacillus alkaliterrae]|uniref:response regulator transcription factor n=1 Tax=Paenibacillus alkaliterrae TaxID=320909 RepID=UPI001F48D6C0|nr:helix-turn-helix domain-containing protein [Paenibacillus alkaliterrae]MCF2938699.1 response regulator [Paenibacillus alkaliterrae]
MYNLLVVDDEEIAIRGIIHGIDWSALQLTNVFTANDAEDAKSVFRNHPVHVMISDIDMPRENGILLLNWVNEHSPETKSIFLTAHANFKYAQQAIQLNSFDYLLKPIDHECLKQCVEKALDDVKDREEERSFRKTFEVYYDQWKKQLPYLVERFWQDVLHQKISTRPDQLESMCTVYGIPLDAGKPIGQILISVEEWKREFNARDEDIMTYALKNAAAEILLESQPGTVIQDQNGIIYALLYDPAPEQLSLLEERCLEFICKSEQYLNGIVSCYIGEPATVAGLHLRAQQLADMERLNIRKKGSVFRLSEFKKPKKIHSTAPSLQEWPILIEQGKRQELMQRVEDMFEGLQCDQIDHTFMVQYYYGLVNMVFQLLQRKSLSPSEAFPCAEWKTGETTLKSLTAVKAWTLQFVGKAVEYIGCHSKELSGAIVKVQKYIESNLHLEFNRELIAEYVYLNPAYLSRLFRKETGKSLTDYMIDCKMAKAKQELANTNVKISDIALSVGYCNFSHFSKLFKKTTGLTPHEYRKKYQDIYQDIL